VKLFSKWKLYIGLEFKFNVLCKSIASKKNVQCAINYIKKILTSRGLLELQRMSPSNARENLFERMPTTKKDESRAHLADSSKAYRKPSVVNCLPPMIFCDSGHLHNEHKRPDKKRKYMNADKAQCKEPELTTSEAGGGTNIPSKQAHILKCKS